MWGNLNFLWICDWISKALFMSNRDTEHDFKFLLEGYFLIFELSLWEKISNIPSIVVKKKQNKMKEN